jgi:dihydrofolate reductase
MKLSLIVAGCCVYESTKLGIGFEGNIPWSYPMDMAHFKKTTYGHFVMMGMTTWKSIGKPLPGRINIILTSQYNLYPLDDQTFFVNSLEKGFDVFLNKKMLTRNYLLLAVIKFINK